MVGSGAAPASFLAALRGEDDAHYARAFGSAKQGVTQPRACRALCALLGGHFSLAALYDLFILYASYRYSDAASPPAWLSSDGLVLNPLVGPSARTLTVFGAACDAFVVLKGETWRLLTAMTLSTSVPQLFLHLWAIRSVVPAFERRRGSSPVLGVYLVAALIGGIWTSVMGSGNLTGLSAAGVAGLLSVSLVEMGLSTSGEHRQDRLGLQQETIFCAASPRGALPRSGLTYLMLALELLPSFSPYSTVSSFAGGVVAGGGCGLFLFAYLLGGGLEGEGKLCPLPCWRRWGRRGKSLDAGESNGRYESIGTPRSATRSDHFRDELFTDAGGPDFGGVESELMYGDPPPPPPPPIDDTPPGVTPRNRRSILPDADEGETPVGEVAIHISTSSRAARREERASVSTPSCITQRGERTSDGGGTLPVTLTRLFGLLTLLSAASVPPSLLAAGIIPSPDTSALAEGAWGCRLMRRLLTSTVDGAADSSSSTMSSWMCSEACVPLSLIGEAKRSSTYHLAMQIGQCQALGYHCGPYSSYDIGMGHNGGYTVEVDLYGQTDEDGMCPSSSGAENSNGGYAQHQYAVDGGNRQQ